VSDPDSALRSRATKARGQKPRCLFALRLRPTGRVAAALPRLGRLRAFPASPNFAMATILSRARGQPECAGSIEQSDHSLVSAVCRTKNRPVTRSRPTSLRRAHCLEGRHRAVGGPPDRERPDCAPKLYAPVSALVPVSQGFVVFVPYSSANPLAELASTSRAVT
jgi:hypothetical protein